MSCHHQCNYYSDHLNHLNFRIHSRNVRLHLMDRSEDKTTLLTNLLSSVNQCQIVFGFKTQLATENDERVQMLCEAFDNVFKHGLKQPPPLSTSSLRHLTEVAGISRLTALLPFVDDKVHESTANKTFWNVIKEQLSRHELERFESLKHINTDVGRCRAWLRSSLNERMLENYLHAIVNLDDVLQSMSKLKNGNSCDGLSRQHYEDWAFMLDVEKAITLPNMAAGLSTILFALNIDKAEFNETSLPSSLLSITANISSSVPTESVITTVKGKKKAAKIINFDDDDGVSMVTSSSDDSTNNQLISGEQAFDGFQHQINRPTTHLNNCNQSLSISHLANNDTSIREPSKHKFPTIDNYNSNNNDNIVTNENLHDEDCGDDNNDHRHHGNVKVNHLKSTKNVDDDNIDADNEKIINLKINGSCNNSLKLSADVNNSEMNSEGDLLSLSSKGLNVSPLMHNTNVNSNNIFVFDDDDDDDVESGSGNNKKTLASYHDNYKVTQNRSSTDATSKQIQQEKCVDDLLRFEENLSSNVCAGRRISLVPLNKNGKPYNLNIMHVMQGDNASESYGSFDSQDIPYNELLKEAYTTIQNEQQSSSLLQLSTSSSSSSHKCEDSASQDKCPHIAKNKELLDMVNSYKSTIESLNEQLCSLQQHDDLRTKYEELLKENNLLKEQMKSYLEAVKLKDNTLTKESNEIKEYEQKLLQIAEMHGELMEFNEKLHKKLLKREKQMKTMHVLMEDMKRKVNSRTSEDLSTLMPYQMVNLIIPSAFLQGSSTGSYHLYQIYIKIKSDEWITYRRYAEFYELNHKLKKHFQIVKQFNFPPKKTFGKMDPKLVEERRKGLESYLRKVLSMLIENCPQFAAQPCKTTLITVMPFFSMESSQPTNSKTRKYTFVSPTIRNNVVNNI